MPEPDALAPLGGAVLSLGFVPLCCRATAALRAAAAQWALLAVALAARALRSDAPGLATAAALLLAVALLLLSRARRHNLLHPYLLPPGLRHAHLPHPDLLRPHPGTAGSPSVGETTRRAVLGVALVALGAAVARDAALLQSPVLRATLSLALPTVLLGLLAAALRPAAAGIAGLAAALGGVLLTAGALPDAMSLDVTLASPVLMAVLLLLPAPSAIAGTGTAPP